MNYRKLSWQDIREIIRTADKMPDLFTREELRLMGEEKYYTEVKNILCKK